MRRPTSVRRPSCSTAPSRASSSRAAPHAAAGGRVEPRQRIGIVHAQRRQRQRDLGQIGARDLGLRLARALLEVVARVQAQRAARARPPGAAGPLCRRGLADPREGQRGQAGPGRVRRHSRQTGIDHAGDAVDRHGRLGHVRGQDDLAPLARAHGARLVLERHLAVQRQHREGRDARQLGERGLRPPDLARAREEHQQVTVLVVAEKSADRARDLRRQRPIVGRGQVLDRDVEHPALAADDVAADEIGDRVGVERRGHRHHGQVRAVGLAQPAQPGEGEIGGDVALVQLVEHDHADAGQARRRQHAPDEQPFGHEPQPRLGPGRFVEADRIADGLADAFAQLAGDARRGQPRGQPARLEHPDLPVATPRVEQRARNTRRLARARRGLHHGGAARRDGVGDRRQAVVDRQREVRRHRQGPVRVRRWLGDGRRSTRPADVGNIPTSPLTADSAWRIVVMPRRTGYVVR